MTEKQFHLKIKWKNREKTEAIEIVLYDDGQPLCELISVDDARLVRDVLNEQYALIKRLKTIREEQIETILKLKRKIQELQCTIEANSQDDYIDYLEKQNERLKERIRELATNDKIVFMIDGDVE